MIAALVEFASVNGRVAPVVLPANATKVIPMDEAAIIRYIVDTFEGVDVLIASREAGSPEIAWGDAFFSYDPGLQLPPAKRFPFATIVTKDYGEFDCASQLDRPGVFRLNIGVCNETYRSLFGPQPPTSPSSGAVATDHDFAALDQLLPHPVYASQSWVCVLNPGIATFESVRPLLAEAYQRAVNRYSKHEPREQVRNELVGLTSGGTGGLSARVLMSDINRWFMFPAEDHDRTTEAEGRPMQWWRPMQTGMEYVFLEQTSELEGLRRRVIYLAVGMGIVAALGVTAPVWVGLTVLVVWCLPYILHAAVYDLALIFVGLIEAASTDRMRPKNFVIFLLHQLELCAVILAAAFLADWLL